MLNYSQVEFFEANGYVIAPNMFSPAEMTHAKACFGRLLNRSLTLKSTGLSSGAYFVFEKTNLHRVVWCGGAEPLLLELAQKKPLLEAAGQILGSDVMDQLICQAHFKIPGDGIAFEWHQDSQHRGYGGDEWQDVNGHGSFVQTVTSIDPMQADNGPLRVLAGSHKCGHLDMGNYPEREAEVLAEFSVTSLTMRPGDTVFLHPYLVHGSTENRSQHPRRVFINGFSYPGANSRDYPGEGAGRQVQVSSTFSKQ